MTKAATKRPRSRAAPARGLTGDLLVVMTGAALRARYGRGPLRVFKWLLDPYALVGVYLLLITFVLDRAGPAPGLALACAVVPFQLVTVTVTNSLISLSLHRSIILNMRFRRTLIPAATTLTELVAFSASLSVIVLMMAVYRVEPTLAILWLPVAIVQTFVFALALAYPAALFGLYFRELHVLAISVVRTFFFLSAGLVPIAAITGTAGDLLRLNPFTGLFETFRHVFLYGTRPEAWDLLYPIAVALILMVLFVPAYVREQHQFAKVVE